MNRQLRISIMVGFCFMLGLTLVSGAVAGFFAERVQAAESGLDMGALLDWVLSPKALTSITPRSQWDTAEVIVPDSAGLPEVWMPVYSQADGTPVSGEQVYYVMHEIDGGDGFGVANGRPYWQGPPEQVIGPLAPEDLAYSTELPIHRLLSRAPTMIAVNALITSDTIYHIYETTRIYYSVGSQPDSEITLGLGLGNDIDNNALPDNLSILQNTGAIWTGQSDTRTVIAANLDFSDAHPVPGQAAQTVRFIPEEGLLVDMPLRGSFLEETLISANDEAIGVFQVAADFADLVDDVGAKILAAWEARPGELLAGAPFASFHFFKDTPVLPVLMQPIEEIWPLGAQLSVEGAFEVQADPTRRRLSLWYYPLTLDPAASAYRLPTEGVWAPVIDAQLEVSENLLSYQTTRSGIVLPLVVEIGIEGVIPQVLAADSEKEQPVVLRGFFPTWMSATPENGVTPAEAAMQYEVTLDDASLAFRTPEIEGIPAAYAISPVTSVQEPNQMYLWAPAALTAVSDAAVRVAYTPEAGDVIIQNTPVIVKETALVTTAVIPMDAPATITLAPGQSAVPTVSGEYPLEAGRFFTDATVTAAANVADGWRVVQWLVNDVPVSTDPEYTFTPDASSEITLTAVFEEITEQKVLLVTVAPANSGTVFYDAGDGWLAFPLGNVRFFDIGTRISLRAEPASSLSRFRQWIVNNQPAGGEAILELTMDDSQSVLAQFDSLTTLTLEPSDLGAIEVVSPEPTACDIDGVYCFPEGTAVTLRAAAHQPQHHVLNAWIVDGITIDGDMAGFGEEYTLNLVEDTVIAVDFKRKSRLDAVNLATLPVNRSVPAALTGVFPTWMSEGDGLTAEEAEARYEVLVGDAPASFIAPEGTALAPMGEGVTPLDEDDMASINTAHIWTPAEMLLEKKANEVLLTIRDRINPLNTSEISLPTERFARVATLMIETVVPGDASAFVLVTPEQSAIETSDGPPLLLASGDFLVGESIELNAVPPHTFVRYRITANETVVNVETPTHVFSILNDTHVEAIFESGAYQLKIVAPAAGTIITSPGASPGLPTGWYNPDAEITLRAVPPAGGRFIMWTHDLAGERDNPITLIMNGDKEVGALILSEENASLRVLPSDGGRVDIRPAGAGDGAYPDTFVYSLGTTVTLTAITNPGYRFDRWRIIGDSDTFETRNPWALWLTKDFVIEPLFVAVFRIQTLVSPEQGGTIHLTPPQPTAGYDAGTEVRLEARPASENSYRFSRWTGNNAFQLLPNTTTPTVSILMDSNKQLIANFARMTITAVEPAEAWIFGGVVVKISGSAFTEDARVRLGNETLVPFDISPSGGVMYVTIPPLDDAGDADAIKLNLEVEQNTTRAGYAPGFTYRRRAVKGNMYTAAFIADNAGAATTLNIGRIYGQTARITVPPLGEAPVYGIARIAPSGAAVAGISDFPGAAASGLRDVSVHLFAPSTNPNLRQQYGLMLHEEVTQALLVFDRPHAMTDASPQETQAVRLSMALDPQSAPNYDALRKGFTLWGVASQYDYVSDTETTTSPAPVYQSQLLGNEVMPGNDVLTPSTDIVTSISGARIYGGSSNDMAANRFTWRQGAALPAEARPHVRLTAVNTRPVGGTGTGNVAGGTALTIVSPGGGLAWIDSIELVSTRRGVGGVVATRDGISQQGENEYVLEFKTPKSNRPGVTSVVIRSASAPDQTIRLNNVFEYTRAPIRWWLILLLMLGIALSIIGMATG